MGLFTDCIYKKLPFPNLSIQDVEIVAKHHFPENEIYREGNKLFIKSNKLMDSRRHEFRANGEIIVDRESLCFKTKVNRKTLLFYLFGLLLIIGLMVYRAYNFYQMSKMSLLFGNPALSFWSSEGLELLGISVIYLLVFAFSLANQLRRVTNFLVRTIVAALEIYKTKS